VGVPLAVLPVWAQRVAGFMPGRYAVEALQPAFNGSNGLEGAGFRFTALAAIGLAAGVCGAKIFRWEPGARRRPATLWVAGAMASWAAVGAIAWGTGQLKPVLPEAAAWSEITEAQIAEISFSGLPADGDIVASLARAGSDTPQTRVLGQRLASWTPGKADDAGQAIRNLVALAAIADLSADAREADLARVVFREITRRFEPAVARQALAWVILSPDDGTVIRKAPELGLFRHPPERLVRQRSAIYAQKYLGRLLRKIPD
jgi:ABC-2 type transport system permease protein